MNSLRRLLAFILVLALVLPLGTSATAAETDTDSLILQLINYYRCYQEDAQTDYGLLLDEMAVQNPALAESWRGIMDFWIRLNRDMQVHEPILPDGLPDDDSLCIVVMGFYLQPDGGIRKELEARLQVTLASAEKYPNAYILCTGGGTAAENRKVTEAGQMKKWLTGHGIAEDRIITETKASSTIENAVFGCELLYRDYPQINSLAVITSDYHVRRSCLYFNTQAAMDAYSADCAPIRVVSGASCPIKGESPTDVETQAEGMCILTGLKLDDPEQPVLSVLEEITVSPSGVRALYSSGRSLDISDKAVYDALDFSGSEIRTVTVTYEENGETRSIIVNMEEVPANAAINLPAAQSSEEAPVLLITEATENTSVPTEEREPADSVAASVTKPAHQVLSLRAALWIALACVVMLIVLLKVKSYRHRQ